MKKTLAVITDIHLEAEDKQVALRFTVHWDTALATTLGIYDEAIIEALKPVRFERLSDLKTCWIVSRETDGRMGAGCLVDFAGFFQP